MKNKFEDAITAPRTYWTIINYLLYNKKIPLIPLVDGNFAQILINFRFRACFEQGVPWHSGNYRVQVHSETRT